MNCLIIFILLIEIISTNRLINKDLETTVELCTEFTRTFWDLTWRYFKGRYAVTISSYGSSSMDLASDIIACSMENAQLSVQSNANKWNINEDRPRRKLNGSDVFYRHEVNGLIFITESAENIKAILDKIDQQTKTVVVLTKSKIEEINDILETAWKLYHILDIIVCYTTKTTNLRLHVSVYNPFIVKNGTKGYIRTLMLSSKSNDGISKNYLEIINSRLMDVHDYPLLIMMPGDCSVYLDGFVCNIIQTIIEMRKFKPAIIGEDIGIDLDQAGYAEEIDLEAEYVDIIAKTPMSVGHHKYEFQYSEFLYAFDKYEYGFVVPKIQPSFTISFVKIFAPEVCVALACAYITMVMFWRWFQMLHHKWRRNHVRQMDIMEICYTVFGNFLLISQPGRRLRFERCLYVGWILFSMVICYSYLATMVEHLTAGGPSSDINTLDELADSGLRILMAPEQKRMIEDIAAVEGASETYKTILKNTRTEGELEELGPDRREAFSCDIWECFLFQTVFWTDYGEDTMHLVKEIPPGRYRSFVVPIDSPYRDNFNQILMKMVDSGLTQKWWYDYADTLTNAFLVERNYSSAPMNDIYRMGDLSFIFWSWFSCCCFCCAVFLLELLWVHICRRMHEFAITFLTAFSR